VHHIGATAPFSPDVSGEKHLACRMRFDSTIMGTDTLHINQDLYEDKDGIIPAEVEEPAGRTP